MDAWVLLAFTSIAGVAGTVEVHFENKDGGFFLKHTPRQHYPAVADLSGLGGKESPSDGSTLLSIDRFTVFQTSQPMSVRATYGPFSTKQTVPARYIVPDPMPMNASSLSLDMDLSGGHHLDMSAHVVRPEIPRDSPVLRVLFHTGADPRLPRHQQQVCILVHAVMGDRPALTAACSPDGEDGVCLAEITVPASWWAPLPLPDASGRPGKPVKTPQRSVKVSYSVLEPRGSDLAECLPRVQIQPVTPLASVPLTHARSQYREVRTDDMLIMMLPHSALFPRSRIHVPVFLQAKPGFPVSGFILRARVKSGLRVLGAECSDKESWNTSLDVNPKHTVATVTAFRRSFDTDMAEKRVVPRVEEVFTWLLEVVEDSADLWDEGRLVWSVRYVREGQERGRGNSHHRNAPGTTSPSQEERKKITARLEIQKDDIQAVLPISKNWEVINTAVLTGRQVSQAMKVFIVSQAGKVADVTLQSSCHSEDESVLKVSSSCSSVYVDGSEIRGSWNASVLVKYGTYTGLARFTLWMPEFPLEVNVADFRLSQIKGWRVPDEHFRYHSLFNCSLCSDSRSTNKIKRSLSVEDKRWVGIGGGINTMVAEDVDNGVEDDKHSFCRLRYQQSPVEVFARFLAADHDSGRVSYLVSRRTWLRVTDLVLSLLRVSDPRIASLHGRIVQGRSVGRTEVQVLSAITGRVIGAKEVRVGSDKVSVSKLRVNIVSGLQLNISPDTAIDNGYIAETSVTRKLTAQYQEGLLDMEMEFSDGSTTPLRDISLADYSLVVDSLSPDVVAFAPNAFSHPRVIAVGEGRGELLRVALLTPDECRTGAAKRTPPLISATAQVQVDFASNLLQHRPDFVQNDGGASIGRDRKTHRETVDLHDILIGIPLKDENNHEPTVQARQHHSGSGGSAPAHGPARHHANMRMTPLEIGMYVLLAAFCFAIVVFVVSCVVYASKFKPQAMMVPPDLPPEPVGICGASKSVPNGSPNGVLLPRKPTQPPPPQPQEPTTNAHDWVWLGRATLERASGMLVPAAVNNNAHRAMRITANPSYSPPPAIDSSTYCKDRPRHRAHPADNFWNLSPTPPPLPPHGVMLERGENGEAEYRPPVPPHRNIGVSARMNRQPSPLGEPIPAEQLRMSPGPNMSNMNMNENMLPRVNKPIEVNMAARAFNRGGKLPDNNGPRRHHHHHHHHHSGSKGGRHSRTNEPDLTRPAAPSLMEEGDDLPEAFVEYNTSPPEVKRATIVGNPMFSAEERGEQDRAREDLLALEDLNLGMDYQQIMEYFDNLKESNA
ncbi:transmembrane protein 132E isoform X4 [Homalodisca vitripennis]|uniref:transmembrane protein 132E isoform X4 n=1 Tax=Homalodisca vitripennis TaxID=197043 RepID=UPI001EEAADA4|nr:transmembrane protein 132E isoform X4 [Homalodisca vitripennis]